MYLLVLCILVEVETYISTNGSDYENITKSVSEGIVLISIVIMT